MTPENRGELEGVVDDIVALIPRLRQHDQPLAMRLLEMAIIEIKSKMYGIADDELQALVDTLSGRQQDSSNDPFGVTDPVPADGLRENPPISPGRVVVALREINRSKRKRRN